MRRRTVRRVGITAQIYVILANYRRRREKTGFAAAKIIFF